METILITGGTGFAGSHLVEYLISKKEKNIHVTSHSGNGSFISTLINKENIQEVASLTNLPPVRRDLLTAQSSNAILQTFYEAALLVRPFIDPSAKSTDEIFSNMVESYTSGRSTLGQSLLRAQNQLKDLIK